MTPMRGILALLLCFALSTCGDDGGDTEIGTEGLAAGECTDGDDNDDDGELDCGDRGCQGGPDCDDGGW